MYLLYLYFHVFEQLSEQRLVGQNLWDFKDLRYSVITEKCEFLSEK